MYAMRVHITWRSLKGNPACTCIADGIFFRDYVKITFFVFFCLQVAMTDSDNKNEDKQVIENEEREKMLNEENKLESQKGQDLETIVEAKVSEC